MRREIRNYYVFSTFTKENLSKLIHYITFVGCFLREGETLYVSCIEKPIISDLFILYKMNSKKEVKRGKKPLELLYTINLEEVLK